MAKGESLGHEQESLFRNPLVKKNVGAAKKTTEMARISFGGPKNRRKWQEFLFSAPLLTHFSEEKAVLFALHYLWSECGRVPAER